MITVVGLGQVDTDIVQPVLGPHIQYIEHPTEADLAGASGAIVRAAYRVDDQLLASMKNLKVVARTGVGTELVDVEACSQRDIAVVITPGSNTNAVAEGVFAHALHLSKRLGPLHKRVHDGTGNDRSNYPVFDLEEGTMGIIGFGRIGKRVADIAKAFGMEILAFDPFATIPDDMMVDSIDTLVKQSNVVTLHVPLSEETHHLINSSMLEHFRPNTILINCGRGPLVDIDAAHQALITGKLGGLGLDVFDEEPPEYHPIFDHENVVLTPHVMGLSVNATRNTYSQAAHAVREILEGRTIPDSMKVC